MSLDYKHANEVIKSKQGHYLWLGDLASAEDVDWIKQYHIKTVITAATGIKIDYDASIWHYKYPLHDIKTQNIYKYFDQVSAKIDKGLKKGGVLVHCGAGVSRSATLVIAYLIKYHQMSFHQALKFTKSKRPQICPNLGFQLQLKKYANPENTITPQQGTTRQNFYKPNSINLQTFFNFPIRATKNQSFPQINKNAFKSLDKGPYKPAQVGKAFMTPTSNLKMKSSLYIQKKTMTKKQDSQYLRKMAQFRFGLTNTSNWGIF